MPLLEMTYFYQYIQNINILDFCQEARKEYLSAPDSGELQAEERTGEQERSRVERENKATTSIGKHSQLFVPVTN